VTAVGRGGKSLEEAQEEAGVPPGVWVGRALPAVGLVPGTQVTERQMRNLFGEGLHPDADRIVADRLAAGDTPAAAARASRLVPEVVADHVPVGLFPLEVQFDEVHHDLLQGLGKLQRGREPGDIGLRTWCRGSGHGVFPLRGQ
jgi:hypothetical protein